MYLTTWIFGYELWKKSLPFGISYGNIMELSLHISALSNIPTAIYNIYKSYKNKTGKMRPFAEAIRPLYNIAAFMIVSL
jgi:ethanolaminephosphotransferase